ncbi:MAG: response regulator [Deltaproteobacteria bacterium]|nr:MAG: response regulator [Deltaproteobacteria bacterium]
MEAHNSVLTILLVEDDPGDAELFQESLSDSKHSFSFRWVEDGVSALSFLRREGAFQEAEKPDIVFLDLNLPGKNGLEVLQDIRGDQELCQLPVIMLSTSDQHDDIARSYELGANCYLVKPSKFREFSEMMGALTAFWFKFVKFPLL